MSSLHIVTAAGKLNKIYNMLKFKSLFHFSVQKTIMILKLVIYFDPKKYCVVSVQHANNIKLM